MGLTGKKIQKPKQFTIEIIMIWINTSRSIRHDYHFSIYSTPPKAWQTKPCRLDTENGKVPISQTRNITPIVSITMPVRTQPCLRNWPEIVQKLGLPVVDPLLWVSCSATKSKALEAVGDASWPGWLFRTNTLIGPPCVDLKVTTPSERGLHPAQTAIVIQDRMVKRTGVV